MTDGHADGGGPCCDHPPLGAPPLAAYRGAARDFAAGDPVFDIPDDAAVERDDRGAWVTVRLWMNDGDADGHIDALAARRRARPARRA